MFEFAGENEDIRFDPRMLLKLNHPLHVAVLKQRRHEKPVVLATKKIDWRPLLYSN